MLNTPAQINGQMIVGANFPYRQFFIPNGIQMRQRAIHHQRTVVVKQLFVWVGSRRFVQQIGAFNIHHIFHIGRVEHIQQRFGSIAAFKLNLFLVKWS